MAVAGTSTAAAMLSAATATPAGPAFKSSTSAVTTATTVAAASATVTITTSNQNVAVPTGAVNGSLTLNFAAGGPDTQTFTITPVGLGSTLFGVASTLESITFRNNAALRPRIQDMQALGHPFIGPALRIFHRPNDAVPCSFVAIAIAGDALPGKATFCRPSPALEESGTQEGSVIGARTLPHTDERATPHRRQTLR